MNVCVFCSMYDVGEEYAGPAAAFSAMLARRGHTLVWGGTNTGLMAKIASTAQDNGGRIVGITMERILEKARQNADEMLVAKDLPERKKLMRERADAFALLPGGIGSLDEVTEILELKKHAVHDKPIAALNTGGFYEGLKRQIERMKDEGFIEPPLEELIYFADTPETALSHLERHARA